MLAFGYLEWPSTLGPFTDLFAWSAIATPLLSLLGQVTLVAAALAAPFVPGRPKYKWGILAIGVVAWGAAFYWLHIPGLIELP